MKNTIALLIALFSLFSNLLAQEASPKPGAFKVGDKVEAEYVMGWYRGTVIEVQYDGTQYNVELYPPDGSKPFKYPFSYKSVRAASGERSVDPVKPPITTTSGQPADKPGAFKVGDKVEADYVMGWYPGVIVEVQYEGTQYNVELYPPDGGKPFKYPFHYKSVKAATAKTTFEPKSAGEAKLVYGRYGCTASTFSGGEVTYTPRGSFVITPKGKYTYFGFKKPSSGTFEVDKEGNLLFKGGYLNGGKAEKIDRPNKFFLVFPANIDHRWTCGLVDK